MIWRILTFPFRFIGGLFVLGVASLLFTLGMILLFALLSSHPPSRLVETEAVVVAVREYCTVERLGKHKGSGLCTILEDHLKWDPTRYEGGSWTRQPFVSLRYRDDKDLEQTTAALASDIQVPTDVKVGDRVRIKVKTKSRNWQQWRADWAEGLPLLGLMMGALLAAAVLWTWGGGWRVMARQRRRETRATVAKVQLAVMATAVFAALLAWGWRTLERHPRTAAWAARLRHRLGMLPRG